MRKLVTGLAVLVVISITVAAIPTYFPSLVWEASKVPANLAAGNGTRGKYLVQAAGCASCHTAPGRSEKALAGGRRLKTEFGTFVVPNITQDTATGIGTWREADFIRAMTKGLSPDGRHYYPAFPYTSYAGLSLRDLRDMWSYLKGVPAVRNQTASHELRFPFNFRPGIGIWKVFYFSPRRFEPDRSKTEAWNRGAYLANVVTHCVACHTPRNFAGALNEEKAYGGSNVAIDGEMAPNITPHKKDGIGNWSKEDLALFLESGIKPNGDAVGGSMGLVIQNSTSKLDQADRAAVVEYLLSLKPLEGGAHKHSGSKPDRQ